MSKFLLSIGGLIFDMVGIGGTDHGFVLSLQSLVTFWHRLLIAMKRPVFTYGGCLTI